MGFTWSMDCINDSADYGVIDDIEWDKLRYNYKAILGLQEDVTLTDKYRPKKTFKLGKPVIVCTNEVPCFTDIEKSWLSVNVAFYLVNSSVLPSSSPFPFVHYMLQ